MDRAWVITSLMDRVANQKAGNAAPAVRSFGGRNGVSQRTRRRTTPSNEPRSTLAAMRDLDSQVLTLPEGIGSVIPGRWTGRAEDRARHL